MKDKKRAQKLSRVLKARAGEEAPSAFQDYEAMGEGGGKLTWNDVIAQQILKAAAEGKQWAIEMYRDQTEGKPAQAKPDEGGDRSADERLESNLAHHLNRLVGPSPERVGAEPVAPAPGVDEDDADVAEIPAAPARGLLDLPKDGHHDPEDA